MSGGTEGVLSPHITVFTRKPSRSSACGGKRLAIGIAKTRPFRPEEIGRTAQIEETARAVREAMQDAEIAASEDVHFVQIKCPLLTAERVEDALSRGRTAVTKNSYASMSYSRAASALGVALALGEIAGPVPEEAVAKDWQLYSAVASASAGVELLGNVVIVFGNSAAASSPYVIGHAVMKDAIDLEGVLAAFASAGLEPLAGQGGKSASRAVNVFAKAEASPDGLVRGLRHTMLEDTDISSTRHARAAVGGLIAGVMGSGAIYVSGGAEHQGPPGGGPVAIIAAIE
jgi:cyanuric acid amidohydrolase